MNYKEATDFLFTSLPMFHRMGGAAYKANLNNTLRLDSYFDHPHRKFRTIHVAGTNGKGSVSHMLAALLQTAGYKTGLYTSPHLLDFRERVKINGLMIPEEEVTGFVENHRRIIREIEPSFFEMTVALAFDYFARQGVEVAVIETGMGGRLDSTNIIDPILSIITNISLDHTQFLGNTLEKIAEEKAGIIKTGVPVVIGETRKETAPVFTCIASEKGSPILFADQIFETVSRSHALPRHEYVINDTKISHSNTYRLDLAGHYQEKNLKTVLAAVKVLRERAELSISEDAVQEGLERVIALTGLSGRWQVLSEKPLTVVDTGHNEGGLGQIVEQIRQTPHRRLFIIFGVVNDKDLTNVWPLLPRDAHYLFTQAQIERALKAEQLAQMATEHGFKGEIIHDIRLAVRRAQALADARDMIFIGGSTFTVAEALSAFQTPNSEINVSE